ncbi:MAG: HNH endonuclease [Microcoleus sp. PH2017_29_MFU_D_A]|uniref:RNA-guided endonuclease IscB n=1 Tax=unclassified Microcoleus TaxID=2642155 RepID=UPI001DFE99A5|nr:MULTISPECIES: RNA-guided endonuclease IscB [unclassified Microcoleus]MCC3419156.1 HNH endonuclease [Microcoleus sp. PH2017_07_MST_O_A]MCC3429894.1 HNH endonuclease [Microcoleus sp. PH2017_04_SCI_O_A]MCC3464852.1 HNH endonuclease [Microcoleus sp. PH2017_06_SFM_O_A]MCC3509062.1 HNH endonuclease [Microcoleus sp. PH2017_17_BER_D_A]TAE15614.1 MAG: HNH endonuclease [Oscillatoriales cyanobacterium]
MQIQANYVFLLNHDRTFLNMVHPARARELLTKQKAAVYRSYPFAIVLKQQILNPTLKPYRLKIDPGSKWTGFAIQCGEDIVFGMELKHRGLQISADLKQRASVRGSRRSRNLRYRAKRFNRKQPTGWLAPSLRHRVQTVETWIKRFMRYSPITEIEIEQVRFDTQLMQNPEISGVQYQAGELAGYEVKQYLLEKWEQKCSYCGATDTPLEVEHIQAKSKGGSNRVSNLALSCVPCNQKKGNRDIQDFLSGKPDLLQRILAQAKQPLKDAAAVNSTRFAIVRMAKELCDTVKCWTGGRTKFNRTQQGLEKSHSIDAACVGKSGRSIQLRTTQPLIVTCFGHGTRQEIRVNKHGFPAVKNTRVRYKHVKTGDTVKFTLDTDRKNSRAGTYTARVKKPTAKGFEVLINQFRIGVSTIKNVKFIHRQDGYSYRF